MVDLTSHLGMATARWPRKSLCDAPCVHRRSTRMITNCGPSFRSYSRTRRSERGGQGSLQARGPAASSCSKAPGEGRWLGPWGSVSSCKTDTHGASFQGNRKMDPSPDRGLAPNWELTVPLDCCAFPCPSCCLLSFLLLFLPRNALLSPALLSSLAPAFPFFPSLMLPLFLSLTAPLFLFLTTPIFLS